jgi:alpha-1,6-mannosyltransferase
VVVGETRRDSRRRGDRGPDTDGAPADPRALDRTERKQLDVVRRFGTVGSLMLAIGSLGAGAAPVFNPVVHLPVLGLFTRMPTVSLTLAFLGMWLLTLAWLGLGRLATPGRVRIVSIPQLGRTLMMWITPLVFVVPMFSRDVYSYLAQSEIAARGLDPYKLGPADALSDQDPLTVGVPTIWRDTPSPYGPLFLTVGKWISKITHEHVVSGIVLHRVLALLGLALIVWALPRLARRFGVNPASALWLGAANPLVLFHLVVGVHNEALAIGLMLVGFELALKRMPKVVPEGPFPAWQPGELRWYAIGATVVTMGAAVKIPAALALGFLGVMIARRRGGKMRHLFGVAGALGVIFLAVLTAISLGSGLGYGWVTTLNTANSIKSWMAPTTSLGFGAGGIGLLLGLGNHVDAAIGVARAIGTVLGPLIAAKLLWDAFRWKVRPLVGLGVALGAVLLFGATVQPWYLLWAALPLAVAAGNTRVRTLATVLCAVLAVVGPAPTGYNFDGHVFVLTQANSAALIVVIASIVLARKYIPKTRPPAAEEPATSTP